MVDRLLTLISHRIYTLPILVLMPHSRCNCRCIMCDIWKANHEKKEITPEELEKHISSFRKIGLKNVTMSGGEALMHANLWTLCEMLKSIGVKISLLSTGITLSAHAANIIRHVDEVIVSMDGSPAVHNRIRGLPSAFQKLQEGVETLKELKPSFRISARCVLQKLNFRDLANIITSAKTLGLDQISFLAADISSSAFNRAEAWGVEKVLQIGLNEEETNEFEKIIVGTINDFRDLYASRFIAERPAKMLDLVRYYKALLGSGEFPVRHCNAPWVSAVLESDGEVRPCFFHKSYGNIYNKQFLEILNSPEAVTFRAGLNVKKDTVCEKCVCSLKLGLNE